MGAFPVGFRGNCQDFANALTERLTGTIQTTTVFSAQYGGPQPKTDVGPWWQNGTDLYVFDYSTGQYQPMEDQTPIGMCAFWGGAGAPPRWLLCQGQRVQINAYQRLYQRIRDAWGPADGVTFALPPCGKYLIPAGYDGISGNTYNNGTTGGVAWFLLQPEQLPEIYVPCYGTQKTAGALGDSVGRCIGDATSGVLTTNWFANSADGLPVTQRNGKIYLNPQWQAMNLCIRYI